ncbi:MAG: hypothetical protein QXI09_01030 [Candidatus Aenigmatarchaeota archaeon]
MEKGIFVLILAAILILSSLAYNYTTFTAYNKKVEIPKEKILNKISNEERDLALQYGYTIIYYNYTQNFDEIKNYLESIVSNKAIILILNYGENRLVIESLKGKREITNPSLNETIKIICEITIDTPLDCVLREI